MRTAVVKSLHFVAPIAVEFISIAVASVFVLGGFPLAIYLLIFLALGCLIRIKRLGKLIRVILAIAYVGIIVFSINGLSVMQVFLFHASKLYFSMYVFLVFLSGFALSRRRFFNLRWYHGVLFSTVFVLAGFSIPLSEFSMEGRSSLDKLPEGVEVVVDYQIFENSKGAITPRYFELDPEEKTLFICNRLSAPHTHESLLVYNIESKSTHIADLQGLTAMGIKFDPFVDSLAVIAYREATPMDTRHSREAALVWVDRAGKAVNRAPIHQRLSLYSLLRIKENDVNVLYRDFLITYNRQKGSIAIRRIPIPSVMIGVTNFLELEDRVVLCTGGAVLNMLVASGLYLFDQQMTQVINSHKFLVGAYALGYDSKKEEIYVNSVWGGTLRVYDKDLNLLRKVKLGKIIRAIAIDSERRVGYAAEYIDGDIIAFNLDTGERVGSINIGRGARALKLAKNGDLYAGSRMGVFRISQSVWNQPLVKKPN